MRWYADVEETRDLPAGSPWRQVPESLWGLVWEPLPDRSPVEVQTHAGELVGWWHNPDRQIMCGSRVYLRARPRFKFSELLEVPAQVPLEPEVVARIGQVVDPPRYSETWYGYRGRAQFRAGRWVRRQILIVPRVEDGLLFTDFEWWIGG